MTNFKTCHELLKKLPWNQHKYQCYNEGYISHGYTNVDWARGWDTRHSTLSNYFILMNGVIS